MGSIVKIHPLLFNILSYKGKNFLSDGNTPLPELPHITLHNFLMHLKDLYFEKVFICSLKLLLFLFVKIKCSLVIRSVENALYFWLINIILFQPMEFTDAGDAIAICEKNGWTWEFKEPPVKPPRAKSYAANFSWNKRTRRSCK